MHNSLTNGKVHVYLDKQIPVDIKYDSFFCYTKQASAT